MANVRPYTALLASLALLAALGIGCATQLQMPGVSREDLRVEQERQRELILATRWQREKRLMNVSSHILVAGAELCGKDVRPYYGLHVGSVADISSEFRSAAESLLGQDEGRGSRPRVVGVLEFQRRGLWCAWRDCADIVGANLAGDRVGIESA